MFKVFASSGVKIIISRFVFVSERTLSRPLCGENSNPQKIAQQCHLLSSYPVGEAAIFILKFTWLRSFPAPSGTGTPPAVACGGLHHTYGEQTKRAVGWNLKKKKKKKKVIHLKRKMFPEINLCLCQKRTGARGTFQEGLSLHCATIF